MLYHENSQHMRVMQLKYKSKYEKLKRHIKNLVLENAALADEVAQIQADLYAAREDRRYLAKRLLRHGEQTYDESETNTSTTNAVSNKVTEQGTPGNLPKKRGPKKGAPGMNNPKPEKKKLKTSREKLKLDGNLNSIIIHSIGEIIPVNPNFHTEHSIYPVGYVASRVYAHPKDPRRRCVYTCKILNNAGKPQFQIIPDNDLDSVYFGETADVCHQLLLEAMQQGLSEVQTTAPLSLTVQGDKFFGLSNNMVKSLLQMDPSFNLCAHFKGFPTHDPSFLLPEDQDPSMSFDALQRSLVPASVSFHNKNLPPDELLNFV